jgi:hypothetical protein
VIDQLSFSATASTSHFASTGLAPHLRHIAAIPLDKAMPFAADMQSGEIAEPSAAVSTEKPPVGAV